MSVRSQWKHVDGNGWACGPGVGSSRFHCFSGHPGLKEQWSKIQRTQLLHDITRDVIMPVREKPWLGGWWWWRRSGSVQLTWSPGVIRDNNATAMGSERFEKVEHAFLHGEVAVWSLSSRERLAEQKDLIKAFDVCEIIVHTKISLGSTSILIWIHARVTSS